MTKISIGVMSCGKDNFKPRYESCMNTWAQDFDRVFFFAGEGCQDSRLVSLYNVQEDYDSAFYKQMYGLGYMYFKSPDSDWYFICGDDNFLYKEHMYEKMSEFDSSQNLFIGGHCGDLRAICKQEVWYKGRDEEFWRNKCMDWGVEYGSRDMVEIVSKSRDKYWGLSVFPSGGAGFFISRKLLETCLSYIPIFIQVWPNLANEKLSDRVKYKTAACDVAMSILLYEYLGIKLSVIEGLFGLQPCKYEPDKPGIDRPISFHYIKPEEMYRLYENKQKGIYK